MNRRRRELPPEETARFGREMCRRVLELPEVRQARQVAGYAALPGEVNLDGLFEYLRNHGKEVLLPRYEGSGRGYVMVAVRNPDKETCPGNFGIREPRAGLPVADTRGPDTVWLVPGLAFDRRGRRIGRGGGHYDRLLNGAAGYKIGLAFSWQLVPEVPAEPHDVRVDTVVTERETAVIPRSPQSQSPAGTPENPS